MGKSKKKYKQKELEQIIDSWLLYGRERVCRASNGVWECFIPKEDADFPRGGLWAYGIFDDTPEGFVSFPFSDKEDAQKCYDRWLEWKQGR